MTPTLLAITFALTVTLCYVGLCATVPFRDCRRCGGMGYATKVNRRGQVKRGKDCRRCKATGKRIRTGRHLYNVWSGIHRDGTR
ncbi:hypothetical protein [Streptomyces sp. NPDC050145]|uniref:hypothetical protein n=1 Tax=Streptomyces sp. NPDC050145 TaxID=3365602 RepID=UPI00379C3106